MPFESITSDHDRVIRKLISFGDKGLKGIEELVTGAALDTQERITEIISGEVRSHDASKRKTNSKEEATDLVETGTLRRSFIFIDRGKLSKAVATNIEYAPALEYGYDTGTRVLEGFFFARKAAEEGRVAYLRKAQELIRRLKG